MTHCHFSLFATQGQVHLQWATLLTGLGLRKSILDNMKELIINKSRFISYKFELNSLDDVKTNLENLKKQHKKATHFCYAYVYNKDVVSEKCSDDGEPGGTAGYPILNVIKKKELKNVLVVVVRYFGGVKLGAGGLTRAYTKSVAELLNEQ